MTTATNQTALEQLLQQAADEPAYRPEFLRQLLESEIYVLGTSGSLGEGRTTLAEGTQVQIQHWEKNDGSTAIPFFTSLAVLQQSIESEQSYIAMPARSLFELTQGTHLVLNPLSPYGKEFVPAEVAALLNGGVSSEPEPFVVKQDTKVMLGQPKDYPSKMVDSLTQLFSRRPAVKLAYLAQMFIPSQSNAPELVIGLVGQGDLKTVIADAGSVVADTAPPGMAVNFTVLQPGSEGIGSYLLDETKPFYEQSWGTKLRSFFGSGRA